MPSSAGSRSFHRQRPGSEDRSVVLDRIAKPQIGKKRHAQLVRRCDSQQMPHGAKLAALRRLEDVMKIRLKQCRVWVKRSDDPLFHRFQV